MAKYCPWCGKPVSEGAKFCEFCGKALTVQTAEAPRQTPPPGPGVAPPKAEPPAARPSAPSAAPPKRNGRGALTVVLIALVLALGVLAYTGFVDPGFWKSAEPRATAAPSPTPTERAGVGVLPTQKPTDEKPAPTPKPTPTPGPTPEPTPDATPEPTPEPTPDPLVYVNPFVDVNEQDAFMQPVAWAMSRGIATAKNERFHPEQACSRAQELTFLYRAMGSPACSLTESPYSDVDPGSWYGPAVLWAYEQRIIFQADNGRFEPEKTITRAEAMTTLYRAAATEPPRGDNPFNDVTADDYFYDAVLWAVENGISSGTGKHSFSPGSAVTKAQMLTFLYRTLAGGAAYEIVYDTPDFEKAGIECTLELGVPETIYTYDYNGTGVTVPGTVTLTSYKVFASDASHKGREGYEWRCVSFTVDYSGPLAEQYGVVGTYYPMEDYYHIRLSNDSLEMKNLDGSDHERAEGELNYWGGGEFKRKILWKGEEYEISGVVSLGRTGTRFVYVYNFDTLVPVGYDGLVYGMMDRSIADGAVGKYIYEYYDNYKDGFHLFRLN